MASPVIIIALTFSRGDELPDRDRLEACDEADLVADERAAHDAPLRRSVHERGDRQHRRLRRVREALLDHRLRAVDASVRHGVDPTAEREEHVLLAPDHALGHARRAARVEDVAVVGGARAEVAFGRSARHRVLEGHRVEPGEVGVAPVLDDDRVAEHREPVEHAAHPGCELALVDERLEVGVVEEVRELLLDVPEVDVHPDRTDLEDRPGRLDPLDRVEGVDADVVARPDPVRRQVVGEPVRPLLHLGERAALALAHEVLAVAEVIGGVLEQVGEVELHALNLGEAQRPISR